MYIHLLYRNEIHWIQAASKCNRTWMLKIIDFFIFFGTFSRRFCIEFNLNKTRAHIFFHTFHRFTVVRILFCVRFTPVFVVVVVDVWNKTNKKKIDASILYTANHFFHSTFIEWKWSEDLFCAFTLYII